VNRENEETALRYLVDVVGVQLASQDEVVAQSSKLKSDP